MDKNKLTTFVFAFKNDNKCDIHNEATLYINAIDLIRANTLLFTLYAKNIYDWELIDSYSYITE